MVVCRVGQRTRPSPEDVAWPRRRPGWSARLSMSGASLHAASQVSTGRTGTSIATECRPQSPSGAGLSQPVGVGQSGRHRGRRFARRSPPGRPGHLLALAFRLDPAAIQVDLGGRPGRPTRGPGHEGRPPPAPNPRHDSVSRSRSASDGRGGRRGGGALVGGAVGSRPSDIPRPRQRLSSVMGLPRVEQLVHQRAVATEEVGQPPYGQVVLRESRSSWFISAG